MSIPQQSAQKQYDLWQDNPYYAQAEERMDCQWNELIWPRIKDCNFTHVVDLACGHGRNSEKFLPLAGRITLVDLSDNNITFCRKRFAGRAQRMRFTRTTGVDIPCHPGVVTLLYCFDAMVHFSPEVVCAYIYEAQRVLTLGGHAFFHHSNLSTQNPTFSYNPHARNHMTQDLFKYWVNAAGLEIVSSDVIPWGQAEYRFEALDCITVLKKVRL